MVIRDEANPNVACSQDASTLAARAVLVAIGGGVGSRSMRVWLDGLGGAGYGVVKFSHSGGGENTNGREQWTVKKAMAF